MKNKVFLISLAFLSLICNVVLSQNITIKGKVLSSSSSPQYIRLLTYNDMLTCEQILLYETKTDENNEFVIKADVDEIKMAQIAVDLERVDILLRPDSSYDIEITIPDQENDVSYFERQNPSMKMIDSNDDGLYYQYCMSEMIIDDFLLNNFNRLYKGRQSSLLDTLDAKINSVLGSVKSDYVSNNVRYKKAAIYMMINSGNTKRVVNQYFNQQDILYSNLAYMNLFYEVFADYLSSHNFSPSDINNLFNYEYDRFLTYLKEKDVFLSDNSELAEIIIALNLKRMYYENPNERNVIMDYLDCIVHGSKNQRNQKLVSDMVKQIKRLSFNSDAPAFSLKDKSGKMVELADYKDDILVLQFVDQYSTLLDYQFEALKELSCQWQDSVVILTVATKNGYEEYKQIFDDKGFEWNLLNLDDEFLLLEKYQIKTFPDYVILGKNGKIGMAPAPAPDQYLDYHVRRIFKYYKK